MTALCYVHLKGVYQEVVGKQTNKKKKVGLSFFFSIWLCLKAYSQLSGLLSSTSLTDSLRQTQLVYYGPSPTEDHKGEKG